MLSAILKLATGTLWPYVQSLMSIYLTEWGRNLLDAAMTAVTEAERQAQTSDGWTGAEKRAFAVAQLKGHNWGGGPAVTDRVINLAIELACARLQPKPATGS